MAWTELTEDHVRQVLSEAELDLVKTHSLSPGQTDPVESSIASVAALIQGYCRSAGYTGTGNYIPASLVEVAKALLAWELPSRLGGQIADPSGARRDRSDWARGVLKDVADGRFAIEMPDSESGEASASIGPTFSGRDEEFGKEYEDGI